jgi:hypothetical protein
MDSFGPRSQTVEVENSYEKPCLKGFREGFQGIGCEGNSHMVAHISPSMK